MIKFNILLQIQLIIGEITESHLYQIIKKNMIDFMVVVELLLDVAEAIIMPRVVLHFDSIISMALFQSWRTIQKIKKSLY